MKLFYFTEFFSLISLLQEELETTRTINIAMRAFIINYINGCSICMLIWLSTTFDRRLWESCSWLQKKKGHRKCCCKSVSLCVLLWTARSTDLAAEIIFHSALCLVNKSEWGAKMQHSLFPGLRGILINFQAFPWLEKSSLNGYVWTLLLWILPKRHLVHFYWLMPWSMSFNQLQNHNTGDKPTY